MIEDKKLGLKVAENKYEELAEKIKADNKQLEISLEINKVVLEYLEKKAKE